MKSRSVLFVLFSCLFFLAGCARPQGDTPEQKREYVLNMANETLAELYANNPEARALVERAVGYAVFSDINTQLLYFGTGNGYGVVTDNSDGFKTYMRMGEASAGLGVALTDFREVIIFNDESVYSNFVTEGWNFGAQGQAGSR
jgi:lipid-binding SYLF domain-containing protein